MSRLPKWTEEQQEYLDKIRKKTSFNRLVHWITERERVRLAKEANQPAPWTKDPILQNYRFCNVRRMDDKVSKWLLDNWYRRYFDHPNMIIAVTLARQLNRIEALEEVGFPEKWSPSRYKAILNKRVERGEKNFSFAYMITGRVGGKGNKIDQLIDKVTNELYITPPTIDTASMQKTAQSLLGYKGFSDFIAGQVVADLRWAVDGTWLDRNDWAPKGPGSTKGMNIILNRPENNPITQEEFLSNLVSLIAKLKTVLNPSITKRLEAHDYQNCLCELSKYNRTLQGEGTPKQLYSSGNL